MTHSLYVKIRLIQCNATISITEIYVLPQSSHVRSLRALLTETGALISSSTLISTIISTPPPEWTSSGCAVLKKINIGTFCNSYYLQRSM